MTLEQAYKIGNGVVGFIKCTYAMIFDTNNGAVWSFQRRHAVSTEREQINTLAGVGYQPASTDATLNVNYEMPICTVAGEADKNGNVPVYLTKNAVQIIKNHFNKRKDKALYAADTTYYVVWQVFNCDYVFHGLEYHKGERVKVYDGTERQTQEDWKPSDETVAMYTNVVNLNDANSLKPVYEYVIETRLGQSPEREALMKALADYENTIVYVREVAIDWIPTDIENVYTSGGRSLNEILEKSADEMQQAKNLLYIVGATNVLGVPMLSVPGTAAAFAHYRKVKQAYEQAKEDYDGIYSVILTYQQRLKDAEYEREIKKNENTYENDFPDGVHVSTLLRVGNLAKVAGPVGKLFRAQVSVVLSNTSANTYAIHYAAADCEVLDLSVNIYKIRLDGDTENPQEVTYQIPAILPPGGTIEIKLPGGVTSLTEEGDDKLRQVILDACGKRLITSCPKTSIEDVEKADILFKWSQSGSSQVYTCAADQRPGILRYCGEAFYPSDK